MLVISLCILAAALMLGVAAPAQAETIGGTVWTGFGVPCPTATATAYHFDGGTWAEIAHGHTDANGVYTITGVPVATGYHVGFAAPGYVDQWWANKATQLLADPINVTSANVTGINATLVPTSSMVITVDAVTGIEPMDGTLSIAWHTDQTLTPTSDGGSFWFWVRSAGAADWYMEKQVLVSSFALPGRDFEADIAHLAVPDAAGYQIVVAYVPNEHDPFVATDATSWGTSAGSFAVRAGLTVNTPVPATYAKSGAAMQVVWNTAAPISSGSFGIWVRSSSLTNWYQVGVRAWKAPLTKKAGHKAGFTNWSYTLSSLALAQDPADPGPLPLDLKPVPAGTGYQVIVSWEPNAWPAGTPVDIWVPTASAVDTPSGPMCWATSPGPISVTGADTLKITSVPDPGTGVYAYGDTLTVSWTTSIPMVATDYFGYWARSTNGTSWFPLQDPGNHTTFPAAIPTANVGRTSYSFDAVLGSLYTAASWVPAGEYQVIVAYRASSITSTWQSYGTGAVFTVVP